MANERGNPKIAEYGRATRFGAGNDARAAQAIASPPWSIRNVARRMAGAPVDTSQPLTLESLLRGIGSSPDRCSPAELLAATLWLKAMEDYRAMEVLTVMIDGKHKVNRCKADAPDLASLVNEASSTQRLR